MQSDPLDSPMVKLVLKYQPKTTTARLAQEVVELRDVARKYFMLLQYHHNAFEREATYEEIEVAAMGAEYPYKEEK